MTAVTTPNEAALTRSATGVPQGSGARVSAAVAPLAPAWPAITPWTHRAAPLGCHSLYDARGGFVGHVMSAAIAEQIVTSVNRYAAAYPAFRKDQL